MNQMEEKRLEVLVNGISIGKIKMELNGRITIVDGGGIISTGKYLIDPEEIKERVYNKMRRDYRPKGFKGLFQRGPKVEVKDLTNGRQQY